MVVQTPKFRFLCDDIRGRIGRPSGFGAYVFGANRLGDYNLRCGVYQLHRNGKRKTISQHIDNFPKNPRSVAQTARRNLFKAGMFAWKNLDTETRAEYNSRVYPKYQYGVNRFLTEYMKLNS